MILTNVLHPRLDAATDFPEVHHRGRSRAGCSHMTSDLPLGSQWGSRLRLGSSCPLMWWLKAVGFAWTHPPWHPLPLDPLHYSYGPIWCVGWRGRNRIWKRKHQGSRPSQITRNFCLTSPEVANTGIEQFFKGTGSESRTGDQWGVPRGLVEIAFTARWLVNQCGSHGSLCHCENWSSLCNCLMISSTALVLTWNQCSCHFNQTSTIAHHTSDYKLWVCVRGLPFDLVHIGTGQQHDVFIANISLFLLCA